MTAPARNPKGLPTRLPAARAAAPVNEMPALELARRIVELIEDKKAADIVLLDIRLPDGSGFDVCRRVLESLPDTRIVIQSPPTHLPQR